MAFVHGGDGDLASSIAEAGKILLLISIIVFFLLFLLFIVHLYFRSRTTAARHDQPQFLSFLYFGQTDQRPPAAAASLSNSGLDHSVIQSLPTFTYASDLPEKCLECAICLSAFLEKEIVRLLPQCDHGFHVDCIDMWFHSHSTCPVCRTLVRRWHSSENWISGHGFCIVCETIPVDSISSLSDVSAEPENSFTETNATNGLAEAVTKRAIWETS